MDTRPTREVLLRRMAAEDRRKAQTEPDPTERARLLDYAEIAERVADYEYGSKRNAEKNPHPHKSNDKPRSHSAASAASARHQHR